MEEEKSVNLRVFGRVQGVFFRAFTQKQALKIGIKGYVKNMPDESVEVNAVAEPEKLKEFISMLRKGPPQAIVERIEEKPGEKEQYNSFKIEY